MCVINKLTYFAWVLKYAVESARKLCSGEKMLHVKMAATMCVCVFGVNVLLNNSWLV